MVRGRRCRYGSMGVRIPDVCSVRVLTGQVPRRTVVKERLCSRRPDHTSDHKDRCDSVRLAEEASDDDNQLNTALNCVGSASPLLDVNARWTGGTHTRCVQSRWAEATRGGTVPLLALGRAVMGFRSIAYEDGVLRTEVR